MTTNRQDWVTTARQKTVAAIREGRMQDAIAGVDAIWAEGRPIHDFYGDMCATFCDFIATELGEDGVEGLVDERQRLPHGEWIALGVEHLGVAGVDRHARADGRLR